jgi:hypothetical protein
LDEEVQPSNRAKIGLEFGPVNDHWIQSPPVISRRPNEEEGCF